MITYIFGHKKPDLDAVVGAVSLAQFRKGRGDPGNPTPVIVDPINPETKYVFDKFGFETPKLITATDITPEDRIILVDHNEVEQRLDGINQDQIVAIVDHHKFNINLNQPIKITAMPVGSTNTIIYLKFIQYDIDIKPELARLMLCAIISDTVGLKSVTTTDKDQQAVAGLSKIAGIPNIDELSLEIFKAKSNIDSLTPEQIVENDYKIFDFAKKTFIGQVETVEQDKLVADRKQELLTAMASVKQKEGVDLVFLAITDVLKVNTKLIIMGEEEKAVAVTAFGGTVTDGILDIGPKMSRKKELAPPIEKALEK